MKSWSSFIASNSVSTIKILLLHENFRVDRLQMTDDGICSLLKLVADRSKFELLRRCAFQPVMLNFTLLLVVGGEEAALNEACRVVYTDRKSVV